MRQRQLLTLAASSVLATGVLGATTAAAQSVLRDKYLWKRRLLLAFAPLRTHPGLAVQRARLKAAADGLAERDMTVIEIVQNTVFVDGNPTVDLNADALRREFDTSIVEFSVILVGKDGGEKLRRDEPLAVARLFDVVDAMPMRRQEMREREQPKPERES